MKKTILLGVLAALCLKFPVRAQETGHLNALRPGDQVPDVVLDNILNYPPGKASLKDLSRKLLILDFWSTWCGSCIHFLPQANVLNKRFARQLQILPVTDQSTAVVRKFLSTNGYLKNELITSVTGDKILSVLFPHNQLPHEVWISSTGKVLAITGDEYVTAKNIESILRGGSPDWAVKADRHAPDLNSLVIIDTTSGKALAVPSSKLTGHLDGLAPNMYVKNDTAAKTRHFLFTNLPLQNIYLLALGNDEVERRGRRRLNVPDPGDYFYADTLGYLDNWEKRHTYCYEAIVPLSTPNAEVYREFLKAVEGRLKVKGELVALDTTCWILQRTGTKVPAPSTYRKKMITIEPGKPLNLQRVGTADLVFELEKRWGLPVIDESGVPTNFDLGAASVPADADAWNSILLPQGLRLQRSVRKVNLFVLTQSPAHPPN